MAGYYGWTLMPEWDEERDPKLYKVWMCDVKETYRCPYPFELWMCFPHFATYAMQEVPAYLSIPSAKGVDWRLRDGWPYLSVVPATEEERKDA